MAGAVKVGISGDWAAWGVKSGTVGWAYFQSKEWNDQSEKNELKDEQADIVALAFSSQKLEVSYDAILKSTGSPGDTGNSGVIAGGGLLTLTHPQLGALTFVTDNNVVIENNGDWVKIRGTATNYTYVSTTTTTT